MADVEVKNSDAATDASKSNNNNIQMPTPLIAIKIPPKYRVIAALVSCMVSLEFFAILLLVYTNFFYSSSLVGNLIYLIIFVPVLISFVLFYGSLTEAFKERLEAKEPTNSLMMEAAFAVISGFGALILYYLIIWLFSKSEHTNPRKIGRFEKTFGAAMALVIFYAVMEITFVLHIF
jgi:hypothetical protein